MMNQCETLTKIGIKWKQKTKTHIEDIGKGRSV